MKQDSFELARLMAEYLTLKHNQIPERAQILVEINRRLDDAKRKRELQNIPSKVHPWVGRMLRGRSSQNSA
jgi:hypothetical protein